jgi:hypothetical protein
VATLIAQQVAGKAARDALFLSAFSVASLPVMMGASAALSAAGALGFSALMRRWSPLRCLSASLLAFATLALLTAAWSSAWPRTAAAAFYLLMAVFGAVLLSGFWSVVNERFDPYTARRAMGRIGLGATLGGVVGGALAYLVARVFAVDVALAALALTSLLCVVALRWLRDGGSAAAATPEPGAESLASGFGLLRRTTYLRDLALLVLLLAVIDAVLDYALKWEAAVRFTGREPLFEFFASYAAFLGLATFLCQLLLARPALLRLGLGGTVAVQPGATFLLASLSFLEPTLLTVALARGGSSAFRDSLLRSGYELLYTPLPPLLKRQAKAVVDVAVDRLGTVLGSAIVLAVAAIPFRPTLGLVALAAALALFALSVCRRLHQGYVRALESNLRSGAVKLEADELVDGTTLAISRATLGIDRASLLESLRTRGDAVEDPMALAVADLRSAAPLRVKTVLGRPGGLDPALAAHAIPLLAERHLAADVIRALRPLAPRITGQLVDALLDRDADASIRRRVVRILKVAPGPRTVEGLLLGLSDPVLSVRVECGKTLAALRGADHALRIPPGPVEAAVLAELRGAAPLAPASMDHVFALLSLILDAEPVLISLQALRGENPRLRGTALEYLENVLSREVREALWMGLGIAQAPRGPGRAPQEMEDELLQSSASRSGDLLRRALLRPRRPAPRG